MDRFSLRLRLAALALVGFSLLPATSINASHTQDPEINFAQLIIVEIEALQNDALAAAIPTKHAKQINNRLRVSIFMLGKGINYLQQDKDKQASKHFKNSKHFINLYLKLLSQKVERGKIDPVVAEPLQLTAITIRSHINQLILGDLGNSQPVANAGIDQSTETGQIVTLDGSASTDPDGDTLQFQWVIISEPVSSNAVLDNAQSATASFTALVSGEYIAELVVSDGQISSVPDTVTINVSSANTQPVADAGADQTGLVSESITLDGSGSSDVDGDSLIYAWSLVTVPPGSTAQLSDPAAIMPSFTADLSGLYEAELVVNDGSLNSDADRVAINIDNLNTKPVADAGPDQSVFTNDLVQLDGSSSFDVDGDPLIWFWSLTSQPVGSAAQLNDPVAINPTFIADLAGQYIVQLVVNDGEEDSDADSVVVNAVTPNTIPVADAGPDQSDIVGSLITLDGSASSDADGDPLNFDWALISTPAGSNASLDNPSVVNPGFVLDISGDYVAQLIVNDGQANSVPDETVVSTINSRPVANAGNDQTVTIGDTAQLDGTASSDVDGDTLSFSWSIASQPVTSNATLSNPLSATPTFTADEIGFYVFQLIVSDGVLVSIPATVTLQVNPVEDILITLNAPLENEFTNQTITNFIGNLNHTATLTIDGQNAVVQGDFSFNHPVTLTEGLNTITLVAVDAVNSQDTLIRQVNLDTSIPPVPSLGFITVSLPDASGLVTISGQNGAVEPFSEVVIVNLRTNEITIIFADANGAFSVQVNGQQGDTYRILSEDVAGNQSATVDIDDGSMPDDPAEVAPPLDPMQSTSLLDATSFLYTGANPIQTGVAPGTIEAMRTAVIRGIVLDKQNNPLPGVTITIKDHAEYGQTLSRTDGMFDMAVNGGVQLTINYTKDGYLPVQRYVKTEWRDYYRADDVVMIQLDAQVTTIDLLSTAPMQVAQGSVVTDIDGTRQATLAISQGTSANMILPDGTTQAITTLNIRATEYTIGANGLESMPGQLPPTSGYTYAVELSIDEAIAAGATSVEFNQPVNFYVDNFLNFPVGELVPVGFYDRAKAAWIPSPNGKIIKIVSVTNGLADISLDVAGTVATQSELDALGITTAEQQELTNTYPVNTELWRVQIIHMSTLDCNWGVAFPEGSTGPDGQVETGDEAQPNDPTNKGGSIIEAENQVLGERIDITGTPYTINYRSSRTPGSSFNKTLNVSLIGDTLPPSLKGIDLTISIAGREIKTSYGTELNQTVNWVWDGKDGYGRTVSTRQKATITVDYIYPPVYTASRSDILASFALAGGDSEGIRLIGNRESGEIRSSKSWEKALGGYIPESDGLGLWTMSNHHFYDSESKILYRGDGTQVNSDRTGSIIETVAGNGQGIFAGDNGPAVDASLRLPSDIAFDPDGLMYIADNNNNRIRKIDANGIITTVVGDGGAGYGGDEGPAISARLNRPNAITFDSEGVLYIADTLNHRIRRVDKDGIITTVIGNGLNGFGGDGGPAELATLSFPSDISIGSDGAVYIADGGNSRIRKVSSDNIIATIAGNGDRFQSNGDGGLAINAAISPERIAIGQDGELYFSSFFFNVVRKVGIDGIITTVAGKKPGGFTDGDGGLAVDASFASILGIFVGLDNTLYIADSGNFRVRKVDTENIITTVAGDGLPTDGTDGKQAVNTSIGGPRDVIVDPEGALYIATQAHKIRRVTSAWPDASLSDNFVPSKDGQLLFHFDQNGQHLRTLDAVTGAIIFSFAYNDLGILTSITDVDGDVTMINRQADGIPTSIVSQDGQITTLSLDTNGDLATVADPVGNSHQMTYNPDGLMLTYTDPNGGIATYQYDLLGRLISDVNPVNGGWTINRTENANGYTVVMTSAEGRNRTFQVESLPIGDHQRTTTSPDNKIITRLTKSNGETTLTHSDGSTITIQKGPDPRFGMIAPVDTNINIVTPSGLTSTTINENTAILADSNDPLSVISLVDTTTINGRTSSRAYNAATQTWAQTTAESRTSTVQIDAKGQPVLSQTTGLDSASFSYDTRGRLQVITEGAGATQRITTMAFYPTGINAGFLQSITDAENQVTSFEYDAVGRVTKQILPDAREITYIYDANGNLTSLTPPGRPAHVFNYNGVDLEDQYTPPSVTGITTPQTIYAYNLDKKLTSVTRPDGQLISLNYGTTTGQLDSMTIPTGNYIYSYNPTSAQLQSVTAPDGGELSYAFDGFLTTSSTLTGDVSGSVDRVYDNDFRIASRSINGANTISFGYDSDSLLTLAGSLTIGRETQKAGLINGTTLGSLTTSRTYNSFAEMDSFDASFNATSLFNTSYIRDKLGRITQKTETIQGVTSITDYSYDLAGQLETETTNGVTITYSYDSNGNRTHIDGVLVGTYNDQDRLNTYQSASYQYTDNGELLSKTESGVTTDYQYDVLSNLRQVTLPGGVTIDYVIDGQNRRIGRKVDGVLTQGFLYKDQFNPIAELDGNNQVVSRFIYGTISNVPDYMVKGGTTYRIISDHLGSPRLVVDTTTGTVAQRIDYDTWGNITSDTNPGFQPFGFAGGIYDLHTELVRFGARDYDVITGRWTSKDTIRFEGGDTNLFGYTFGDPVNGIDPSGEIAIIKAIVVVSIAVALVSGLFTFNEEMETAPNASANVAFGALSEIARGNNVAENMEILNAQPEIRQNALGEVLDGVSEIGESASGQIYGGPFMPFVDVGEKVLELIDPC